MKKVFLSLAVLASVAMVSCSKKAAEGENAEGNVENTDSVCNNDSCAKCDSNVVLTDTTVVVDTTIVEG